MKRNLASPLTAAVLCLALTGATAFAADAAVDAKAISKTLSSVPAPELAPTAAKLVKQASAAQMEQTVREVVLAAVNINPTAPVAVVGAISSQEQKMAPVAAGTAAVLAPKQAVAIAKAAATAAPGQAAKIVQVVCEAAPKQYRAVALTVSRIAPDQSKAILDALAMAVPELKDRIAQIESKFTDVSAATLPGVLQQVEHPTITASLTENTPSKLSPTPGPAFQTPIVSPTVLTPSDSQPSGGQRYETPAP